MIVAIPTRDLLLVTGSEDREGIERIKQMVNDTDGAYHVTKKLFVRRNGRFDEFKDDAVP